LYGAYRPYYGYRHYGYYRPYYGYGLGLGLGSYWPYYGTGYGSYPYSSYDYGDYPYAAYNSGYYNPGTDLGSYTPSTSATTDAYMDSSVQQPPQDNSAHLRIDVPADAKVWFNDQLTQQTGTEREFVSPPLTPGKNYSYDVVACWTENGKSVEVKRTLHVRANMWADVDLTKPEPKQMTKGS
jgi:uncharacterized protein (TIGR03000 family)